MYFERPEDLVLKLHSQDFLLMFNKYRCVVLFGSENQQFEKALLANHSKNSLKFLVLTSVLKVHECLIPYLIRKEPILGENLTKEEVASTLKETEGRPPIVEAPHTVWIKDIDIWFSFPETWSEALMAQIPETYFFKFFSDV